MRCTVLHFALVSAVVWLASFLWLEHTIANKSNPLDVVDMHSATKRSSPVSTRGKSKHIIKAKDMQQQHKHHQQDNEPVPENIDDSALALMESLQKKKAMSQGDEINNNADDDPCTFFVVGDWGNRGSKRQLRVARAMADYAARRHPKFIISTGDNMYDTGISTVKDKQFKITFENVYGRMPELAALRWYMSLGNHDHGYHEIVRDVMAQVNYTKLSKRWYMPWPYYHARDVCQDVDLFVLDTYELGRKMMSETQIAWLERALSSSRARWKVVVGHRAIVSAGFNHGSSKFLKLHVLPLMEKYHATLYFAGDDHTLQSLRIKDVQVFVSGAGSRTNPKTVPVRGLRYKGLGTLGFAIVTLRKKGIVGEKEEKGLHRSSQSFGTVELVNATSRQ
eukprot:PhM_4_TR11954/c0_g1_i2/m.105581/K14379/ACP5; tartrate-resistant acid phosphatase type 5